MAEEHVQQEANRRAASAPIIADKAVQPAEIGQKMLKDEHYMKLENIILKRQLIEHEIKKAGEEIKKLEVLASTYANEIKKDYFPDAESIDINMGTRAVTPKAAQEKKENK
jgi:hypothetical protein